MKNCGIWVVMQEKIVSKNRKRTWTEEEEYFLTSVYGKQKISYIAKKLHRTNSSVQHKAKALGVSRVALPTERTNWTQEEVTFLERHYEIIGAYNVAKHLNRSLSSVKHKANRMNLNSYITGHIFLTSLAESFQSDPSVVHRWKDEFGLKMIKQKRGELTLYRIYPENFWKWAELHKEIIPFHKYQKGSILPEPEWLNDAIASVKTVNARTKITNQEIEYVKYHRGNGRSFQEIAENLGRTVYAVKHIWQKIQYRKE